jgi:hypothetical protein
MVEQTHMTRRELFKLLGLSVLPPASLFGAAEDSAIERRYRADAQILILSVPILRRLGVGGGAVRWREWRDPAGLMRLLEFTGYSNPERAAGLNRLGFIREQACREGNSRGESDYFGVMTASPEESAEEAHKALHSTAKEATYTAIEGRIARGRIETASSHFTGPAKLSTAQRNELFQRAEQALTAAPRRPAEFQADGAVPPTFLQALADSLGHPAPGPVHYVYSGRLYLLWLKPAPDPGAANYFRQKGILRNGAKVTRVAGKVRRQSGGKETNFRIWVAEGATQPLPLRIDFAPKSYLRLIFEADG